MRALVSQVSATKQAMEVEGVVEMRTELLVGALQGRAAGGTQRQDAAVVVLPRTIKGGVRQTSD